MKKIAIKTLLIFFMFLSAFDFTFSQSKKRDTILRGYWKEINVDLMVKVSEGLKKQKSLPEDSINFWCFEPDNIFIIEKAGTFEPPLKNYTRVGNKIILSHKDEDDTLVLEQFDILQYQKNFMVLKRPENVKEQTVYILIKE